MSAPGAKACKVDGCERVAKTKEMCLMHYKRNWRHPGFLGSLRPAKPEHCDVPGCPKPVNANRMCSMHNWRNDTYGDPLRERVLVSKVCTHDGCGQPSAKGKGGLCGKHFYGKKEREAAAGPRCVVPGCSNPVNRKRDGLCRTHRKRLDRNGVLDKLPTGKPAQPKSRCAAPGCNKLVKNHQTKWCPAHYRRGTVGGDVDAPIALHRKRRPVVVFDDGTKVCTDCDERLPLSEYGSLGGTRLSSYCRRCGYERHIDWGVRNPEKLRAGAAKVHLRRAEYLKGGDEDINIYSLRDRDGSLCCWCGEEIEFDEAYRLPAADSRLQFSVNREHATIEHLHQVLRKDEFGNYTSPGHVWENVALAHQRCNEHRPVADYEWAVWPKSRSTSIQIKRDDPPS